MKTEPKGCQKQAEEIKREPKGTEREPKSAKGSQKGAQRTQKGSKGTPKGAREEAKVSLGAAKWHPKHFLWNRVENGRNFDPKRCIHSSNCGTDIYNKCNL